MICSSRKDRLASLVITTANMSAHDFRREVGTTSSGDDLAGILLSSRWTSVIFTALNPSNIGPLYVLAAVCLAVAVPIHIFIYSAFGCKCVQ